MGETGFKHIAVTAAEEDDFVIKAGVVEDEPGLGAGEPPVAGAQPDAAAPAEPDPVPEIEDESEQRQVKPATARKPASKKAGGYRETTLEDLESKPMPFAQKAVIVAAIVCIIGAVIYYFAFMG